MAQLLGTTGERVCMILGHRLAENSDGLGTKEARMASLNPMFRAGETSEAVQNFIMLTDVTSLLLIEMRFQDFWANNWCGNMHTSGYIANWQSMFGQKRAARGCESA